MASTAPAIVIKPADSLYLLNPMAGVVDAFRYLLLRGHQPDSTPLGYAALVTACTLPIAYLVFTRAEATMADIV